MVQAESIEGIARGLWFHYDLRNDVLYLRQPAARDLPTYGEEDDNGLIVLRTDDGDRVVGMTMVNWWRRFGQGHLPDSLSQIVARVEPMAERASLAA